MTHLTLAERSIELVRVWLDPTTSARYRPDRAAKRLSDLLKDRSGLTFTIDFVDRVIRPEDPQVAAANLRRLARQAPSAIALWQRALLSLGSLASRIAPRLVVAAARRTLRHLVGHLIVDARPKPLGKAITTLRQDGDRLNLNLLGEAVLGETEAARRRDGVLALLSRPDVDYVSIKVSAVASQLSMWAFDASVERIVEQLTPLYRKASDRGDVFVNLDMEEYHDLDLTIAVFKRLLESFPDLEAGVVLQAYLPDALDAMQNLQQWASARRANGGAPIKVRVVKGANLAMERVDATMHGWPLATWKSKVESDASYKRVLDYSLTSERVDAIHIGVAGQNLFDIAFAWLLAGDRGVRDNVQFEMLLGMGSSATDAVRNEVGPLVLYTPVVDPGEFDVAIAYLVRRLEENASSENFLSAAFELGTDAELFNREANRFKQSVLLMDQPATGRHRVQDRATDDVTAVSVGTAFSNTPDTDPSISANRQWGAEVLAGSATTHSGNDSIAANRVTDEAELDDRMSRARAAAQHWSSLASDERAQLLHDAGVCLENRRGELTSVMAAETGKVISEGDVEVSEAIDFAHFYAEQSRLLEDVDGATFEPYALTLVIPPWNFPVAIAAGMTLAALASGSAVLLKPAPQSKRCAAVVVEALWQAGVDRDLLQLVDLDEGELSQKMIAHSDVDQVLLTGAWETAALFRSFKPGLRVLAETSGKNALVVTPSADLDLAVADLVKSAFGHAGQKCSAASLGILVGSVGTSKRFRRQLVDAVESLRVGWPIDPEVLMGPVIEPVSGKLASGLQDLGPGESWLVEPKQLSEDGRLWSPGVRLGVRPGSEFHRTEYFGPVLGLMHAESLDDAIAWQSATDYGLTAGIHSLDPDEVERWIEAVQAGNAYVNRSITGAIVRRQPFGGWKRSTVGPTCKAGGSNYLAQLGSWQPAPFKLGADLNRCAEPVRKFVKAASAQLSPDLAAWLATAATSDARAWQTEFGVASDVSGLEVERNLFRYLPTPVAIRAERYQPEQLLRVIAAALVAQAPLDISSDVEIDADVAVRVETRTEWISRMAASRPSRVRLISPSQVATEIELELDNALDGDPDVAVYRNLVTGAGRVELLAFLHEQAISITNHRFGNPDPAMAAVLATEQTPSARP